MTSQKPDLLPFLCSVLLCLLAAPVVIMMTSRAPDSEVLFLKVPIDPPSATPCIELTSGGRVRCQCVYALYEQINVVKNEEWGLSSEQASPA